MGRIGRTVKHQAGVFKRNSKTSNSKSLDTSLPDFNVQFGSLSTWTWHVSRNRSWPRKLVGCCRRIQRQEAAIARGRTTGAAICSSSWCCFVRAAVISSASTCCSRVICIISDLRIPFVSFVIYFSWFLFSWLACLLCSRTRYVCILFPTLIDEFALFCLLCPHNLYLSRMKNQDGHRVHRWCRWVERTVKCEDNNNDNNNNHSLLCPSIA